MAYKKIQYGCSFADMPIQAYSRKNRNRLFLQKIDKTIDWKPIQALLLKHYEPGKSKLGEVAYPPLFYSNASCFRNGFG